MVSEEIKETSDLQVRLVRQQIVKFKPLIRVLIRRREVVELCINLKVLPNTSTRSSLPPDLEVTTSTIDSKWLTQCFYTPVVMSASSVSWTLAEEKVMKDMKITESCNIKFPVINVDRIFIQVQIEVS